MSAIFPLQSYISKANKIINICGWALYGHRRITLLTTWNCEQSDGKEDDFKKPVVPKGREGAAPTHLTSAVAALPGQVLPMDQGARGPAALQREPGVDKRGGAGVVINKESLEKEKEFTANVLFCFSLCPRLTSLQDLGFVRWREALEKSSSHYCGLHFPSAEDT